MHFFNIEEFEISAFTLLPLVTVLMYEWLVKLYNRMEEAPNETFCISNKVLPSDVLSGTKNNFSD